MTMQLRVGVQVPQGSRPMSDEEVLALAETITPAELEDIRRQARAILPRVSEKQRRVIVRQLSLLAPVSRGASKQAYRPAVSKPTTPAEPVATFEDLAGFGPGAAALAASLEHGRAIDGYNLESLAAKRRTEQAAVEYFPGTNIPDSYGLQAAERRRAATRGAR